MINHWDTRYSAAEFAYGTEPNAYFREKLNELKPGKILMPAEGEGRNAVYAASLGWEVTAFDQSSEGRKKAMALATLHNVEIEYLVGSLLEMPFQAGRFDAIGLIFAHFSSEEKQECHLKLTEWLKPGGVIIFEAFSKSHLGYREKNPGVGGPSDIDMLYSLDEVRKDFKNMAFTEISESEIELHEGLYHNGIGSVVRFMARKA